MYYFLVTPVGVGTWYDCGRWYFVELFWSKFCDKVARGVKSGAPGRQRCVSSRGGHQMALYSPGRGGALCYDGAVGLLPHALTASPAPGMDVNKITLVMNKEIM